MIIDKSGKMFEDRRKDDKKVKKDRREKENNIFNQSSKKIKK